MKWIALLAALLAISPAAKHARKNPKVMTALVMALGVLPFVPVHINLISYEFYRGDARGIEITLEDIVALILALAIPPTGRPSSFRFIRAAYYLAFVISFFVSVLPHFSVFSLWKLARMYVVFNVAERVAADPRRAASLVTGLASGVVYETILVLDQRYHQGLMRASGNLLHPNSLGMALNLVFPTSLAILLAGQGGRLAWVTVGGAILAVIMSLSRGAMMMALAAAAFVYFGSVGRKLTRRKIAVAVAGIVGIGIVLIKALDTIIERFTMAAASSEEARHHFEAAAKLMLAEHPLGIGVNAFSFVLDKHGYADRANVDFGDRDGIVHNIYWLTAAETGYFGIVAYAALLGVPLFVALRCVMKHRDDVRGDVLLGIAGGLIVTYVQGKAEWIARQTTMSYLFFLMIALIAALRTQLEAKRAR
jgi:O-antigen ligase